MTWLSIPRRRASCVEVYMTLEQLEKRVVDLEKQLAELRGRLEPVAIPLNVEATFGSIDDDPEFEEIVRLGREYRRQANSEDS